MTFMEDLDWSRSEEVRRKNISIILRHFPIKRWDDIEINERKESNDFEMELIDGDIKKVEFKNYRVGTPWNKICIEIYTDVKTKKKGWAFNLEADYIVFVWHGKFRECYLLADGKKLAEWWNENYKKYEERLNRPSTNGKHIWQSSYAWVPINDLPINVVLVHKSFQDLNDAWGYYGTKNKS
jgi:hypothetical protein